MRVLIASSIDQDAINTLRKRHDVVCAFNAREDILQSVIKDREVVIFRSGVNITAEIMDCAPDLQLLIRAGCGLDNVDLAYVSKRGVKVLRISEPAAQAVAEMTLALMLALARNLREADHLLRKGHWAKHQLVGHLLSNKILGIVGAGNIGTRVGQVGAVLDMQPIGCVEDPSAKRAAELLKKGIVLTDFDEVLSRADFLCIHVSLKDSTHNLIDSDALSRVKPGAFLVNVARGGVVDEEALYKELIEGGRLRGAALDVHRHEGDGKISPLARLPNVILTPHIGSTTIDTQRQIGRRVVEILAAIDANHVEGQEEGSVKAQVAN